ncbi:hypothetical protein P3T73_02130 [Kiritimatiellota bacterium B12222]|nr:hypothetical protein P3T73_02130 [Kiritimatiellota bacterium B12222]
MTDSATNTLDAWELEILDLFVGIFETFGLPKSTAMIYGILYCAEEPMLQEEICQKLSISTGSASQGLKLLSTMGAVHKQNVPGQRQSSYKAEYSMRRLLAYVVDAQLRPKLRNGKERLSQIQSEIPKENTHAQQRIHTLMTWQKKADRALPVISTLFGN